MTPRIFGHLIGTTRYLVLVGYSPSPATTPWVCTIDAATGQVERPAPARVWYGYAKQIERPDLHHEEVSHLVARVAGALFDWNEDRAATYREVRPWPR